MDQDKSDKDEGKGSISFGGANISYDDLINKDILELMGEKGMTEEEKDELYKKMLETIQIRVMARIDDVVKDEEVEEMKKIIEAGDKSQFNEFLRKKGINLDKIYAEEALIYKIEMIELINSRSGDGATAK